LRHTCRTPLRREGPYFSSFIPDPTYGVNCLKGLTPKRMCSWHVGAAVPPALTLAVCLCCAVVCCAVLCCAVQDFKLPPNVRATTDAAEAISGASYAVHAVPVQHSRAFLTSIRDVLPKDVPIICVSKGLEVGSGCMMSEVIPSALGRRQPAVFLSGPSFAKEVSPPGSCWGQGGSCDWVVWQCVVQLMWSDLQGTVCSMGGGCIVWAMWCERCRHT
jgi:hypothetical protein